MIQFAPGGRANVAPGADHEQEGGTMGDRERKAEEAGRQAQQSGGDWRDNPHRPGTREWFAFEDGRRDAGAKDVGPAPGTPAWG